MPATRVRCSVPTSIDSLTSFARVGHFLGRQDLRDAQIDLHEVVDRDLVSAAWQRPAPRVPAGAAGGAAGAGVVFFVSSTRVLLLVSFVSAAPATCGRVTCDAVAPYGPSDCTWPQRIALENRPRAFISPRGVHQAYVRCRFALPHPSQNLGSGFRHHRQQQDRRHTHRLRNVEQHLRQLAGAGLVARNRPGLGTGNELVGGIDYLKRRRRAALEREPIHRLTVVVHGLPRHDIQTSGLTGGRKTSAAVFLGHRRNPADEIPQVVGEIDVVAILVALPGEVAVAAKRDLFASDTAVTDRRQTD